MSGTRVLVVGPRAGLCAALDALGVPYVVWAEAARRRYGTEHVHIAPFGSRRAAAREAASHLLPHGPFTHVIAGTETAVMPAAVARRVLGARKVPQTLALRCHDKLKMKDHLAGHRIPMTPFMRGDSPLDDDDIMRKLRAPVVVKARSSSGGRGMVLAHTSTELSRYRNRGRILERFVDAPECSVESFISGGSIQFANITEYARKRYVNVVPAHMDSRLRSAVLELNRRAVEALRIQWGVTHLECYLTSKGPLFGEVAMRPPGGFIMELMRHVYGFDPWAAFAAMELGGTFDFPERSCAHAASILFYPPPGRVESIEGFDQISEYDAVVEAGLRLKPGDEVAPRTGLEDVGHAIVVAKTRKELRSAWRSLERDLVIKIVPGSAVDPSRTGSL